MNLEILNILFLGPKSPDQEIEADIDAEDKSEKGATAAEFKAEMDLIQERKLLQSLLYIYSKKRLFFRTINAKDAAVRWYLRRKSALGAHLKTISPRISGLARGSIERLAKIKFDVTEDLERTISAIYAASKAEKERLASDVIVHRNALRLIIQERKLVDQLSKVVRDGANKSRTVLVRRARELNLMTRKEMPNDEKLIRLFGNRKI
ncbi:MAG: hypothetical protein ABIJ08_01575 [Nanoarchaeota archaeon]